MVWCDGARPWSEPGKVPVHDPPARGGAFYNLFWRKERLGVETFVTCGWDSNIFQGVNSTWEHQRIERGDLGINCSACAVHA